jgi:hypothetical protein
LSSSHHRRGLLWHFGNLAPFGNKYNHYFLDSLVSPCLYLIDKLQDHFETRQVVYSVSHFVYEIVEFVIFLGRRQSSILSNKPLNKLDVKASLLSAVKAGAGEFPPLSQIKKTQQMLLCDLEKLQDEGLNLEGVQRGAKQENVWHIPSNAAARVMLIS